MPLKSHPHCLADTIVSHILLTQPMEHMAINSTQSPKGQATLLWVFCSGCPISKKRSKRIPNKTSKKANSSNHSNSPPRVQSPTPFPMVPLMYCSFGFLPVYSPSILRAVTQCLINFYYFEEENWTKTCLDVGRPGFNWLVV